MPIDPSIPLQAKGVQLESPVNQLTMMNEALKYGEMNRAIGEQNQLNEYLKSGADLASAEGKRGLLNYGKTGIAHAKAIGDIEKSGLETKKLNFEIDEKKMNLFRERIGNLEFNPSPSNVQAHLEDSVKRGEISSEQAQQQYAQAMAVPEAKRAEYFRNMGTKVEERYKMNTVSANTKATNETRLAIHNDTMNQQNATGALTPESITNAAARYNIDGTLPPLGMGKAGANMRSQILNEAAVQAKGSGVSPEDQRIAQIGNAANKSSLTQLSKSEAMVGAFEKNFVRNADLALKQSTVVDNTGIPIVNSWINAGKRSVTGDPKLSAYDAAIKATVNEYAKIISGSMGNTATALGEIKKVNELLASAQTPEQVNAVINMMKQETQNRMTGFKEQKAELTSGMKGKKNTSTSSSPSNTPALPSGYVVD